MASSDLRHTLTAAETAAQATAPGATARVPVERLRYLEAVERAAAHELLTWEASLRHTRAWTAAAARDKGRLREEKALSEGHAAARAALHAALAERPVEEKEQLGGD